jgi:hypothetical protein
MKMNLTTALFISVLTPSLVVGARPAIAGEQQQLDALVDALVVCPAGAPTRFVDNGDGTICDHETGLMWEQKDPEDGTQDFDNPHDGDNTYTWTAISGKSAADGTAFTDFLARLNGVIASSESSEQLGGYSDWRLPTSAELQTLLLEPFPCSINPCIIDPIFAPTAAAQTWTSTTIADDSVGAWFVNFSDGFVNNDDKGPTRRVRAVRGGR